MTLTEQRAHARREIELPVVIAETGNRVRGSIRFDLRDLSLGGAFVRSNLLFEVGEVLDVEFQIPDGPLIRARGRVVRVSRDPLPHGAGMGLAFSEMSEPDREAVRVFLARA